MNVNRISEKEFQKQVIDLARIYHWDYYHTFYSLKSQRGYPDLILIKPPNLLVVELKANYGKLSVFQEKWLKLFGDCGVETYCWKPDNFDEIVRRLSK